MENIISVKDFILNLNRSFDFIRIEWMHQTGEYRRLEISRFEGNKREILSQLPENLVVKQSYEYEDTFCSYCSPILEIYAGLSCGESIQSPSSYGTGYCF